MSDNLECPFCGAVWKKEAHPFNPLCPLSTFLLTKEQWAMRPPKREQPVQWVSEIDYLRSLVMEFVVVKAAKGG